nr:hypothetical protein CFP56_26991 [Quercus suber]
MEEADKEKALKQGKLGEVETKLTQAVSIVSTHDKELTNVKETMKTCEQVFYNMGFTGTENSFGAVIFQARRFRFLEGWLATVNAIGLPKSSTFRDLD